MRTPHDNNAIVRAKILLRDTDKSIRDIALRLLFSGAPAFCSYFRKRVGVTAQQYRDGVVGRPKPYKPLAPVTIEVECEFKTNETNRTLWLYESHLPLADDVLDMQGVELTIQYKDGSIVRTKALHRETFKSAMQRIDVKTAIRRPERNTAVRVSLAQQTGELEFKVESVSVVKCITAELCFTTASPR